MKIQEKVCPNLIRNVCVFPGKKCFACFFPHRIKINSNTKVSLHHRKRCIALNALTKCRRLFAAGRSLLASPGNTNETLISVWGHRLTGESSSRDPFAASRPALPRYVYASHFASPMNPCGLRLTNPKMNGTAVAAGFIRCGRRVANSRRV